MSFSKMCEILKKKESKKVLLVQCGAFYTAIGEDSVFLHEILKLKCTCFKQNICKVGIPTVAIEKYIEYVLNMLMKIPRTEKFNIGNEYKLSMYKMLEEIMFLNKMNIAQKEDKIDKKIQQEYIINLNKIDVLLNCQRIYLRIMNDNYWIDKKKFAVCMEHIYEIGKIIGGLYKYYAKNNKK